MNRYNCDSLNDIYKLVKYFDQLYDYDYILKIQKLLADYKIKLYLINTNKINKNNYKDTNIIILSNLHYYCKFVSFSTHVDILLNSIEFMIKCIDLQKKISKWIKIIPIFIFIKNNHNQIICGYLMEYVEGEKISSIIKYNYINYKKINQKINSLIDTFSLNNIIIYELNFDNLIWDNDSEILYYTGIDYHYFIHPTFNYPYDDNAEENNNRLKIYTNNSFEYINELFNCIS